MKTLKKKLAQCTYSMSDLINLLIHHWDTHTLRDHSGQCRGSTACSWPALASLFWSAHPPNGWGPEAVCAIVSLSLPKPAWAPHQIPDSLLSSSYVLFTYYTQKWYEVGSSVFPTWQMKQIWELWRLSNFPKVKWTVGSRPPSSRPLFFLLLITFS